MTDLAVRVLAPTLMGRCLKSYLLQSCGIHVANSQGPVLLLAGNDWSARLETYRTCFPRAENAGLLLITDGRREDLLAAQRYRIEVLLAWHESEQWLKDAIVAAHKKQPLVSPSLAEAWSFATGEQAPPPPIRPRPLLSERESEVAALAAQGLPNDEIARLMFVSIHTVKFHLTHAYKKLGVSSRRGLVEALAAEQSDS